MPNAETQARAYQKQKQVLALLHLVLSPLILALMILSAYPRILEETALGFSSAWPGAFAVFFLFFSLTFLIVEFPLSFYSGYWLEKKYDLSTQTAAAWLQDFLKRSLLGFAVSLGLLLALYTLIRHAPQSWWFWAWAGYALFSYGVGKLFPVLIVPLFYKYGPVQNEALKARISAMAARFGFAIERIQSINLSRTTRKANAAFMGIGKTKRVVLSDTLLSNFEEDEIEVVLAHELGHCRNHDIWRMFALNLILSLVSFRLVWLLLPPLAGYWGYAPGDMAALPLLLLLFSLFSLIIQPLVNGISRRIETQADHFALTAMGAKDAFIRSMKKLAQVNLADPNPHPLYEWFFYDHPAIGRRIAYAEKMSLPS